MTIQSQLCDTVCNCPGTSIEYVEETSCESCAPKSALTPEEEAILSRMRAIKAEARPIAQRLKYIEQSLSDPIGSNSPDNPEWILLSTELTRLRGIWRNWEAKLEDAIERKLILLGHRPPRASQ